MNELVAFVARYLVDDPSRVQVTSLDGHKASILQLRVAPEDMGKIIGRNGRVAKALRTLASAAALREGRTVIVEIVP